MMGVWKRGNFYYSSDFIFPTTSAWKDKDSDRQIFESKINMLLCKGKVFIKW